MKQLFSSIARQNTEKALEIINKNRTNPDVLGGINFEENTPLLKAIDKNMPEVALALIQTGLSNPGYENKIHKDNSTLYYAIYQIKKNNEKKTT